MIVRILKAGLFLGTVAAVGGVLFARSKLDAAARAQFDRAFPAGGTLAHGRVHGTLMPPGVVASDVTLGARLIRVERLVMPLEALSGLGRPAEASGVRALLVVPRTSGVPFRTLLASGRSLPDLDADDATLELRAGDPPAAPVLAVSKIHVERRGTAILLDAHGEGTVAMHASGTFDERGLDVEMALGPMAASDAAALLVDTSRATIRGGSVTFEGRLAADGTRLRFRGDVDARDVLVEGTGTPGEFETRLRSGSARVPLDVSMDLTHGADRVRAIREGLGRKGAATALLLEDP